MKTIKLIHKGIVSVLLILLLFSSCDSWKTDLKADIDQESKNYCLFAPGSYWIYQDSATLEKDSAIIVNITYDKSTLATPKCPFLWEEYTMKMKYFLKNNISFDGYQWLTSVRCDYDNVEAGIIKPILLIDNNEIHNKYLGFGSFNKIVYHNGSLSESVNATGYENYYENYKIGNNTFSKVKVFLSSFYNQPYQIRTFWAENVGIIRTEYINEEIFAVRNLIKYKVKPYNQ